MKPSLSDPALQPAVMRRSIVLGSLLVLTASGATLLMPKPQVTSASQIPDVENMLPKKFGAWDIDRNTVPLTVSPEVAQMLSTLYDRTVSRTYLNDKGERIMVSVAYGANQSRALQLHKPEVCYASQGFRIRDVHKSNWSVLNVSIPTMHLVGQMGSRIEPVTYWMRIGDDIARGWFEQNAVRLKYGTRGYIPDGVLFRVSSIGSNPTAAFELQRQFIDLLVAEMTPAARDFFIGAAITRPAG
jgi:EpsI family protein